jgi:hypothetical protein
MTGSDADAGASTVAPGRLSAGVGFPQVVALVPDSVFQR